MPRSRNSLTRPHRVLLAALVVVTALAVIAPAIAQAAVSL
jgi:hypothetical protein